MLLTCSVCVFVYYRPLGSSLLKDGHGIFNVYNNLILSACFTPGLPVTHRLHIFDALKIKFTPFNVFCAWTWPSKFNREGCIHPLKTFYNKSAWKWGNSFLVLCALVVTHYIQEPNTHRFTSVRQCGCDLPCSAMLSAQDIPYIIRHCDLLVLKIIISNVICSTQKKKLKIKMNSLD